ncbi:MAG: hypothetical protein EA363_06560 [Balneolaceae bacterium]|nr:MAG: hypothetical protein EA363_06560 [Balneolaceae bacterium]
MHRPQPDERSSGEQAWYDAGETARHDAGEAAWYDAGEPAWMVSGGCDWQPSEEFAEKLSQKQELRARAWMGTRFDITEDAPDPEVPDDPEGSEMDKGATACFG